MKSKLFAACAVLALLVVACGGENDDVPPPEINLSGSADMVSDNYKFPECQKSVFLWSVEPTEDGDAQLIVHLHKKGKDEYKGLVNELEFSAEETLRGEKVQPLSGGEYFFSIESKGAWTLDWECRD